MMFFPFLSKEARKELSEAAKKIAWTDRKRRELVNTNIDYNFLQKLIDEVDSNPELTVTVYFKSGDKLEIRQRYQHNNSVYGMDGEPSTEEIR